MRIKEFFNLVYGNRKEEEKVGEAKMRVDEYFLLICSFAFATSAQTSHLRAARGSVCGSNGIRYNSHCEFVLTTCKPKNRRFDQIVPVSMKYCDSEKYLRIHTEDKALMCGLDGKTYQACIILKKKCLKKNKIPIVPLHLGACGNCSKENVCNWGKTEAIIENVARKKVCSGEMEYEDSCAFYIARCLQYNKDKSILKTQECSIVKVVDKKKNQKPIRIKKGSICGSDRRKYENFCSFMHSTCKPEDRSFDKIYPVEMKYCENQDIPLSEGEKASMCGINGITYQACQLGLQICNRSKNNSIIPLHLGQCGVCTEKNICSWEEMEAIIAVKEDRKKYCTDGMLYKTKCDFSIAQCNYYKRNRTEDRCWYKKDMKITS